MPERHDAAALLRSGQTLQQISLQLGRPLQRVIRYLQLQAGEGDIKPSEIFYAIPAERRAKLEALIEKNGTSSPSTLQRPAAALGFDWWELDLYCRLRRPSVFRGDLYEYLADTEVALHRLVRSTLVEKYGPEEVHWWRAGVPIEIRKACAQAREADPEDVKDVEMFAYTTLIHLSKIIDENWVIFVTRFPTRLARDKKNLLREFSRLNSLRNAVMHPVKGRSWGQEDFAFVREWHHHFVTPRAGREESQESRDGLTAAS